MASAAERTLDLLARSGDAAAAGVLREALERTTDAFGVEAALAIGRHGSPRLKNDVLRMTDRLSAEQKDALRHKAAAFADAASHGLRAPEASDRRNAVAWVAAVDDFERFGQLVGRLTAAGSGAAEADEVPQITLVCEQLVERIFDLTEGRTELDDDPVRNAPQMRSAMATALAEGCTALDRCPVPQKLIEWTLTLIDPDSVAVQRLMNSLDEPGREAVRHELLASRHPGVMRLAWGLLKRSYPLPVAFDMWRQRQDPEFIWHVLGSQPAAPTVLQIQNLHQIDYVPWLTGTPSEIESKLTEIPPNLLPAVVSLLELIALPEATQKTILRWLLDRGDAATRRQASEMFALLGKQETHAIVTEGLDHEDTAIQAWAASQLRPQDVPNAVKLLFDRLDDPSDEVRRTARAELADFNFIRMTQLVETEPGKVTPAMGRLIRKIDEELLDSARRELAHAIRGRRLTAIHTVRGLDLCGELLPALAALMEDSDLLVRRTAAEALSTVPTREAIAALEKARHDESIRVREAATDSMRTIRRTLIQIARQEAVRHAAEQKAAEREAAEREAAERDDAERDDAERDDAERDDADRDDADRDDAEREAAAAGEEA